MPARFTPRHRGGSGPPLVLLHGFTDTWRTWELVIPALERHHEVLAPTLAGHAGGPPLGPDAHIGTPADEVERAMDEAGIETAHIAGNSMGGYVALQLAARGRARSVVALAPAGGWDDDGSALREVMAYFRQVRTQLRAGAPNADRLVRSPERRRMATRMYTEAYEHIPGELIAHQIVGAAACTGAEALIELALRDGYPLDAAAIGCPVRIIWGTEDRLLPWPSAAARVGRELPGADWEILDGVGHCPQLDVPAVTAELILEVTRR